MNDHIPDPTKMINDTPRTDEQINGKPCTRFEVMAGDSLRNASVLSEFARQLERELNAANAEIEEKRKDVVWLATEKAKLENYVMRLEEAGDAVAAIIGPPGSAHWADENQVDAAWSNWQRAKEDKL